MSGTNRKGLPGAGADAWQVVQFLTEVTTFTERLTGMIESYAREVVNDGICGSWIARQGNRTLLIRKAGKGYRAVLCDTSRLYKVIEREFDVMTYRGKLCLSHYGVALHGEYVSPSQTLTELSFGSYGIFDTEESSLAYPAYDDWAIMDYECDE